MELKQKLVQALKNKREKGRQAEERACLFLKKQGYKILRRNWYLGHTEIDILAEDRRKRICIIEVKYCSARQLDLAKEQVTKAKQRHLKKLYLLTCQWYPKREVLVHVLAMDDYDFELIENALED